MSYYESNKEKVLARQTAYRMERREYYLWQNCKHRAKRRGIEFTLSINDIVFPEFCPVLGIKLEFGDSTRGSSPSIDRIDPNKGYVKENIQIISHRANTIKSNASPEELRKVADYYA